MSSSPERSRAVAADVLKLDLHMCPETGEVFIYDIGSGCVADPSGFSDGLHNKLLLRQQEVTGLPFEPAFGELPLSVFRQAFPGAPPPVFHQPDSVEQMMLRREPSILVSSLHESVPVIARNRARLWAKEGKGLSQTFPSANLTSLTYNKALLVLLSQHFLPPQQKPKAVLWDTATDSATAVAALHALEADFPYGFYIKVALSTGCGKGVVYAANEEELIAKLAEVKAQSPEATYIVEKAHCHRLECEGQVYNATTRAFVLVAQTEMGVRIEVVEARHILPKVELPADESLSQACMLANGENQTGMIELAPDALVQLQGGLQAYAPVFERCFSSGNIYDWLRGSSAAASGAITTMLQDGRRETGQYHQDVLTALPVDGGIVEPAAYAIFMIKKTYSELIRQRNPFQDEYLRVKILSSIGESKWGGHVTENILSVLTAENAPIFIEAVALLLRESCLFNLESGKKAYLEFLNSMTRLILRSDEQEYNIDNFEEALLQAIDYGDLQMVLLLLYSHQVDPTLNPKSAVIAARAALAEGGADAEPKPRQFILDTVAYVSWVYHRSHKELKGYDPRNYNRALRQAVTQGRLTVVRLLVDEYQADPAAFSASGSTALSIAVERKSMAKKPEAQKRRQAVLGYLQTVVDKRSQAAMAGGGRKATGSPLADGGGGAAADDVREASSLGSN